MPQVQVALRAMAQGKTVRVNDVMSYIVTSPSASGSSSSNAALRAYAPSDVLKPKSELLPDIDWYLHKQIFPPIERLCAPIDGTDATHLAECLGLDPKRYTISAASKQDEAEIHPLESQISDEVRYQDAARLSLRCRACKTSFEFHGLVDSAALCTAEGVQCACGMSLANLSVLAQLEHQIRQQTARYYEGWLVCDDPSCGNRTRQMSVYGHRCLGPRGLGTGCLGRMAYEYTERKMYNQLLYFQGLWDVEKAKKKAGSGEDRGTCLSSLWKSILGSSLTSRQMIERVLALAEHNRRRFGTLKAVVDGYLDKCGRQWVQMDSLFGFALKAI